MWILLQPKKQDLLWYKGKLLQSLIDRINNCGNNRIKYALLPQRNGVSDTSILEKLLLEEPIALSKLNAGLMKSIIPNFDENEFKDFLSIKAKKKVNRNLHQRIFYRKYEPTLTLLVKIFDYEGQISSKKSRSYKISSIKGRNSCTYCNRLYSQTVVKGAGANDKERIARPELDHWFSKELYPLMSLSFFNLIPSCSICNSTAKGNSIFRFNTHIHPYLQIKANPDFRFSYKAGINGQWDIIIENDVNIKEKNMIRDFCLKEVYKFHSGLELKDILDFSYSQNDTYLDTLLNQTMMKFPQKSKEDIYRMFFGTELNEEKFLDRPMSKLKFDILKKIGIIEKIQNR